MHSNNKTMNKPLPLSEEQTVNVTEMSVYFISLRLKRNKLPKLPVSDSSHRHNLCSEKQNKSFRTA